MGRSSRCEMICSSYIYIYISPISEELQMHFRILRSLEKHTAQNRSPIQPIGILFGWSSWLPEFVKDLYAIFSCQ